VKYILIDCIRLVFLIQKASLLSDVQILEKMYKFSLNLRWVMAYVLTFWAPG